MDKLQFPPSRIKIKFNVSDSGGGVGLIRVYQEGKLIQTIGQGQIKRQSANLDEILAQDKLDIKGKTENLMLIAQADINKSMSGTQTTDDIVAKQVLDTTTNKAGEYSVEIEPIAGSNTITIEAFNRTNTILSPRQSIELKSSVPKHAPKLYAIVAGTNEFEKQVHVSDLKYAQKDAQDIDAALEELKGKGLYEEVHVTQLIGKDLTKAKLMQAVSDIAKQANPEDSIVFYVSTHGRAREGKLLLAAQDSTNLEKFIDFEQTFKAIQSIRAFNQVFIVDACESGQANDIVSSVYDAKASVLAKTAGIHMLLATTKGTSAFESQDPNVKNGAFTAKILSTLKDKATDKDKDGRISVIELSDKLKEGSVSTAQYPVIRNVGRDVQIRVVN